MRRARRFSAWSTRAARTEALRVRDGHDALEDRLNRPEYTRVAQSIGAVNFHNATDILGTYAGRASDLKRWLAGADINDDMREPRLLHQMQDRYGCLRRYGVTL